MTPADAKAHAEDILALHRSVNTSYVADGGLAKHATTAAILLDLAIQLEAALRPTAPEPEPDEAEPVAEKKKRK